MREVLSQLLKYLVLDELDVAHFRKSQYGGSTNGSHTRLRSLRCLVDLLLANDNVNFN